MECPQCAADLRGNVYEGVPIHTCESCGGEFVGGEELSRIVANRQEQFTGELRASLASARPVFGGAADAPDRKLSCPACGNTMATTNYGGDSGVFVDRCDVCGGIWLDQQELEKIQIVMEQWADAAQPRLAALAGELETARRTAAERAGGGFAGSRFGFVNALINRLLDAA